MYDRNKNKLKIQINRALQNVNNILKPSSEVKKLLEQSSKDIQFQRNDKVHSTLVDHEDGREFILTQHCKDPKSANYRSPYTNRYYPQHKEDMYMLSPLLRDLEEKGNLLFSQYAKLYYGEQGCISNFYVFQTEQGLNFCFYIKKNYNGPECSGLWSSSNLVEIRGDPSKSVSYKVQTAVLYELNMLNEKTNEEMEVNGSVKKHRVESKRWTQENQIDEFHLQMAGKVIEENQNFLRQQIENIFFRKTKDIIFKTRFINTKQEENEQKAFAKKVARLREESARSIDLN